jgi:hypothetical protein
MHLLSAVANCPEVAGLTDHPATFGYVWSVLGWNIHIYHSHLDVHPPVRVRMPFRFDWHQDGGRQNREIETTARPRQPAAVRRRRTRRGADARPQAGAEDVIGYVRDRGITLTYDPAAGTLQACTCEAAKTVIRKAS